MQSNHLRIRDNADLHRFEIDLGNGSRAFAQYMLGHGKIVFTHTEVPKDHEGQGIGTALIRFALDAARDRGLKVVPTCPFFADYLKKHPDVQDLLTEDWKQRLGVVSPD
ncbi:GNAT family N-acetyltransferase [Sphingomonas daechungensis]|uniref:GNAT family N-acetyltransferase n=1 Tax=Sphingomonas daechungensis TaxID=1176646 RepID=UPI0031E8F5B6